MKALQLVRVIGLVAAVLTLVATSLLVAQSRTSIPAPVTQSSGRWQVVNGSPEFRGSVMLLDTATGDTWIACSNAEKAEGWCRMFRSNAPTGGGDR